MIISVEIKDKRRALSETFPLKNLLSLAQIHSNKGHIDKASIAPEIMPKTKSCKIKKDNTINIVENKI